MASKLDPYREVILAGDLPDEEVAVLADVQPATVARYRRSLQAGGDTTDFEDNTAEDVEAEAPEAPIEPLQPELEDLQVSEPPPGSSGQAARVDDALLAEFAGETAPDGAGEPGDVTRDNAKADPLANTPLAAVKPMRPSAQDLSEPVPEVGVPRTPQPSPQAEVDTFTAEYAEAQKQGGVLFVDEHVPYVTLNRKGKRCLRVIGRGLYRDRMARYIIKAAAQLGNIGKLRVHIPGKSPRGWQQVRRLERQRAREALMAQMGG